MFRKGTKLYSIVNHKCPKCHEGDLFKNPSIFPLSEMSDMPDRCPVCNENYVPEQGFYWGAMYINYAVSVGIALVSMSIFMFGFGLSLVPAGFAMVTVLVILVPIVFRYGRSIWINFFVSYDPSAAGKLLK